MASPRCMPNATSRRWQTTTSHLSTFATPPRTALRLLCAWTSSSTTSQGGRSLRVRSRFSAMDLRGDRSCTWPTSRRPSWRASKRPVIASTTRPSTSAAMARTTRFAMSRRSLAPQFRTAWCPLQMAVSRILGTIGSTSPRQSPSFPNSYRNGTSLAAPRSCTPDTSLSP